MLQKIENIGQVVMKHLLIINLGENKMMKILKKKLILLMLSVTLVSAEFPKDKLPAHITLEQETGEGRSNTNDQPGTGFGIYLFDFDAAGIYVNPGFGVDTAKIAPVRSSSFPEGN